MKWIIPLTVLVIFEGIADYFVGKWGVNGSMRFAIISFVGYAMANVSWLIAVHNGSGLARGAEIFSIVSALLAIFIGVFVFKESFSGIQLVGVVLGIVSIVLLVWEFN